MSNVTSIGRPQLAAYARGVKQTRPSAAQPHQSRGSDRVELSQHARLLGKLRELPDVRQELVDRVRTQLDEGTYETPAKINAAVDGLAQDLET